MIEKQLRAHGADTFSKIGQQQKDTILAAGLALQKAGVIKADATSRPRSTSLIEPKYLAGKAATQ